MVTRSSSPRSSYASAKQSYRESVSRYKQELSQFKSTKEEYEAKLQKFKTKYTPYIKKGARGTSIFAPARPLASPRARAKLVSEYKQDVKGLKTSGERLETERQEVVGASSQIKQSEKKIKETSTEYMKSLPSYSTVSVSGGTQYTSSSGAKYFEKEGKLVGVTDPFSGTSKVGVSPSDVMSFQSTKQQVALQGLSMEQSRTMKPAPASPTFKEQPIDWVSHKVSQAVGKVESFEEQAGGPSAVKSIRTAATYRDTAEARKVEEAFEPVIEKTPRGLKFVPSAVSGGLSAVRERPQVLAGTVAMGMGFSAGLGSLAMAGRAGYIASRGIGYGLGAAYGVEKAKEVQLGGAKAVGRIVATELAPFGLGAKIGTKYFTPKIRTGDIYTTGAEVTKAKLKGKPKTKKIEGGERVTFKEASKVYPKGKKVTIYQERFIKFPGMKERAITPYARVGKPQADIVAKALPSGKTVLTGKGTILWLDEPVKIPKGRRRVVRIARYKKTIRISAPKKMKYGLAKEFPTKLRSSKYKLEGIAEYETGGFGRTGKKPGRYIVKLESKKIVAGRLGKKGTATLAKLEEIKRKGIMDLTPEELLNYRRTSRLPKWKKFKVTSTTVPVKYRTGTKGSIWEKVALRPAELTGVKRPRRGRKPKAETYEGQLFVQRRGQRILKSPRVSEARVRRKSTEDISFSEVKTKQVSKQLQLGSQQLGAAAIPPLVSEMKVGLPKGIQVSAKPKGMFARSRTESMLISKPITGTRLETRTETRMESKLSPRLSTRNILRLEPRTELRTEPKLSTRLSSRLSTRLATRLDTRLSTRLITPTVTRIGTPPTVPKVPMTPFIKQPKKKRLLKPRKPKSKAKRKPKYNPSLVAVGFGIKTKKKVSPITSGLPIRPIKIRGVKK